METLYVLLVVFVLYIFKARVIRQAESSFLGRLILHRQGEQQIQVTILCSFITPGDLFQIPRIRLKGTDPRLSFTHFL